MGRRPLGDRAMTGAERRQRHEAKRAAELVRLRARPAPAGEDAALQATARELARQLKQLEQRSGELEAENERLRAQANRRAAVDGCSFCGTPRQQAKTLIDGSRVMKVAICEVCVARCAEILAKRNAERAH